MNVQEEINFKRIAEAIGYIKSNFKNQPGLDEVAEKVNLSSFHFQRLFSEWAGTTPKRFLQYISIGHAKELLRNNQSLFETALEVGLSGAGRLHDLFINIEGMTPGEYKNGGENLAINYSFSATCFGNIIVASTPKGICHLAFYDDEATAFSILKNKFPKASYQQTTDQLQQDALLIFNGNWNNIQDIKLHLKGTNFQLKVWESLLKIPMGSLSTYGYIARQLQRPNASRAVGTAIGDNPVAFLIPCHRVIQSNGTLGGYHWGLDRKTAMIGWEAAKTEGIWW